MFETSNGLDLYSYIRNPLGCKKTPIKMMERHAAQAPALRERHPQIFNRSAAGGSIFNPGLPDLGLAFE
jgi:hypothetical protein